tara:strand:+ start:5557 stop:6315 length:759 start_codon:yes stop_codon:yes gene_type:complete
MRFLLAGSILWIIIFFQKNYPPFSKPALRIYFQFGVLNLAISYGLTYWATQYIYSSLSSIIWSGFPLTVALFSYFMLPNEILTKKKVLSLALGSIGAASILIESINLSGENVTIGVVLVILAVIIASYPSVYLKKYNQIVSSLHINSVSQLMAGIILLSVSYFIENDQQMIWSNYNIFALIYLTIPGSLIAWFIYIWLYSHLSMSQISYIAFFPPLMATTLGWVFLDEALTTMSIIGGISVIFGAVLINFHE